MGRLQAKSSNKTNVPPLLTVTRLRPCECNCPRCHVVYHCLSASQPHCRATAKKRYDGNEVPNLLETDLLIPDISQPADPQQLQTLWYCPVASAKRQSRCSRCLLAPLPLLLMMFYLQTLQKSSAQTEISGHHPDTNIESEKTTSAVFTKSANIASP